MAVIGNILFWQSSGKADLDDVLRQSLDRGVSTRVNALGETRFASETDEQLVAEIVEACCGEPLLLNLDRAESEVRTKRVVVHDHFDGDIEAPGLRVAKKVPFTGEAGLFHLRPNSWDTNPPYGEIQSGYLIVGLEVRESDSERALQYISGALQSVQEYIDRQRPQIEDHNAKLPLVVAPLIARRRASFQKAADIAERLRRGD